MGWDIATTVKRIARKDYHCQASDWIDNAGLDEADYEPEDWATIQQAKKEGWKILKRTEYSYTKGKWEGDWCVFRSRLDLNAICQKYDLYPYD